MFCRSTENGEVIVTLLPVNERFPWVSPAKFRPELVPEELMAPILTLTVEEYVNTLEKLTTDMRFIMYNIMYKRILVIWIATAFIILLALLFSGYQVKQIKLYLTCPNVITKGLDFELGTRRPIYIFQKE